MIYTRFGSKVTVICGNVGKGTIDIRHTDGTEQQTFINELRADGGLEEIVEAIRKRKEE